MKVILREDVDHLGKMGDLVEVSPGHARNFLLPYKKAAVATKDGIKALEHEKRMIEARIKKQRSESEGLAKRIADTPITIPVQVGEAGKLFGSVTVKDIAEAMSGAGVELDKKKILLDHPIKELGGFEVPVKLPHDVRALIRVSVVPSEERPAE